MISREWLYQYNSRLRFHCIYTQGPEGCVIELGDGEVVMRVIVATNNVNLFGKLFDNVSESGMVTRGGPSPRIDAVQDRSGNAHPEKTNTVGDLQCIRVSMRETACEPDIKLNAKKSGAW